MSIQKKPVNYLNNRDLLKEIHSSKNTYCSFVDRASDHKYDFILDLSNGDLISGLPSILKPEIIQTAKENHAARLGIEIGSKVSPDVISADDLVFRVMTWDHVPLSPKQPRKTTKKKTAADFFDFEGDGDDLLTDLEADLPTELQAEVDDMVHARVNFPPFQHYRIDSAGNTELVGLSHWHGSLSEGEFNIGHGQTTDKLARMYMMLCEKYAMKYNWRGYTYIDEMRNSAILQLAYVGLRFNEAKSNNPFAFYTAIITNSFCRVLNSEKRNQVIRDNLLENAGLNPSWTRMYGAGAVAGYGTYADE
jgi:hypothetical protein